MENMRHRNKNIFRNERVDMEEILSGTQLKVCE